MIDIEGLQFCLPWQELQDYNRLMEINLAINELVPTFGL